MQNEELKQLLEKALAGAEVIIRGEGDHFEAEIMSADFEGKSLVQQHQMVYGALGDLMQGEIHALALKTFTPDQWADRG